MKKVQRYTFDVPVSWITRKIFTTEFETDGGMEFAIATALHSAREHFPDSVIGDPKLVQKDLVNED